MATYLLIFNDAVYESGDSSAMSWNLEPFHAGGPSGAMALATGASANGWILDSGPTLWRRDDPKTFVQLATGDFLARSLDFYTIPPYVPPASSGTTVVGNIRGQPPTYVQSTDGGLTAPTSPFPPSLRFPTGSTFMRFWADQRTGANFLVQVREPSGADHLYYSPDLQNWIPLTLPAPPMQASLLIIPQACAACTNPFNWDATHAAVGPNDPWSTFMLTLDNDQPVVNRTLRINANASGPHPISIDPFTTDFPLPMVVGSNVLSGEDYFVVGVVAVVDPPPAGWGSGVGGFAVGESHTLQADTIINRSPAGSGVRFFIAVKYFLNPGFLQGTLITFEWPGIAPASGLALAMGARVGPATAGSYVGPNQSGAPKRSTTGIGALDLNAVIQDLNPGGYFAYTIIAVAPKGAPPSIITPLPADTPNSFTPSLEAGASNPLTLSSGSGVATILDFIRTQAGTFLVAVDRAPTTGTPAIARSVDSGVTWTFAALGTPPSTAGPTPGLTECDDGTVLVPTDGSAGPGLLFRSTDDGQSFQAALTPSGVTTAHVGLKYFPSLNTLFAYVSKDMGVATAPGTAVYLSTDQGQSWTPVFTAAASVPLPSRQSTSWMALTSSTPVWGVDSLTAANSTVPGTGGKTLFQVVTEQAGRAPAFWGRYIGKQTGNLGLGEIKFLHKNNCRVLFIYRDTYVTYPLGAPSGQPRIFTYDDGVFHAQQAVAAIDPKWDVPTDKSVWIYANTEVPELGTNFRSPTAAWFQGWADEMLKHQFGGAGGVYGNTNPLQDFNTPYCGAWNNDSNMQTGPTYLWTNQLQRQCDTSAAAAPPFTPLIPPCNAPGMPPGNPMVVIYQYSIDCLFGPPPPKGKRVEVDLDVAHPAGFASMW